MLVRLMVALVLLGAGRCWASQKCVRGVVEGEVSAGQSFVRPVGGGLEMMLEPLASGWILRVLPAGGARPPHDYAELATPPYQSVNPLLITTDFSFRAQDVVGWNPRRFRFAPDTASFLVLLDLYNEVDRGGNGSGQAAERLAERASRAPEGWLRILDAHLVPGSANQAKMAAAVASHFEGTPHVVEQARGAVSPLGRVTWMRFRVDFDLPTGFRPDRSLKVESVDCRRED